MIQSWQDVLLAAGYRKGNVNDQYISPAGTCYGPEEVARLFGEAMSKTANPLTNTYLQAQAYNAQNQASLAQYYNPQHHGLGAAGLGAMGIGTQSIPQQYPSPTGEIVETTIYDPVLDYVGTIHVDKAFIPMLDYINVVSQQRQAQRQAKLNEPDDFSLDEVRQAEKMIAELKESSIMELEA